MPCSFSTAMVARAAGLNKDKALARLHDLERRGEVHRVGKRWSTGPSPDAVALAIDRLQARTSNLRIVRDRTRGQLEHCPAPPARDDREARGRLRAVGRFVTKRLVETIAWRHGFGRCGWPGLIAKLTGHIICDTSSSVWAGAAASTAACSVSDRRILEVDATVT